MEDPLKVGDLVKYKDYPEGCTMKVTDPPDINGVVELVCQTCEINLQLIVSQGTLVKIDS